MRILAITTIVLTLTPTESCSSFDASSLSHLLSQTPASSSITSGVPDSRGIQAMLNRALGQQTHIGQSGQPIQLGGASPTHHTDWVFDAAELACTDFDQECRWKNVEGLFVDELDWYQGSGQLDQSRLQVATGTHISPDGFYAIVAADRVQMPTSKAMLASDTIGCQIGPGELRLQYWSSPDVHVRVCTRKTAALVPTAFDYCSPIIDAPKPGPVRIALPDGGRQPFQIFIVADNFVYQATALQGGFAIIDNVEYSAEMCVEGDERPAPVDTNQVTPFPKLIDLGEKESTKGVEMRSSITRRGPLPVSPDTQDLIKTIEGGWEEVSKNGVVDEEDGEDSESAEESVIKQIEEARRRPLQQQQHQQQHQQHQQQLQTTARPQRPVSQGVLAARENVSREAAKASRERHSESTEQADEEEQDSEDFSSMSVDGSIDRFLSLMQETQQQELAYRKSACDVLNCRFSDGDCDSMLAGTEWHTADRPIGNPLTGIRGDATLLPYNRDGTFAFVRGPLTHSRLQTQPFRMPEDAFFIFAYHKIDPRSSFRVYAKQAGINKETLLFDAPSLPKNSSRRWFREGRVLPAGDYDYVVFEVHSLAANNYMGLDEILLLDVDRQMMCT